VQSALRDGLCSESNVFLSHKDGHRVPVFLRTFPVRDADGHVIGATESFEESIAASEWERRKNKLESYGCLDNATGVLNRDFTESHLRGSLNTFYSHPVPFAIFCIQADQLERVRSRYSARAAQDVLRLVGQTLEHSLRPNDIVGRWDEDEFLVLLAQCSRSEIEKVGDRLKRKISYSEIQWWGDAVRVDASLGGTTVCPGDTLELLLQRAHQAVCTSVSAGGNRLTILEV
jgi:diguanylate cyclase (GGDEF)-like protein